MKKILLILIFLFVTTLFCYLSRAKIVSFLLSYDFKIPVSIGCMNFENKKVITSDVKIKNLKKGKVENALLTKKILFSGTAKEFRGDTLTIDLIEFENLEINIEYYNTDGKENNWSDIIKVQTQNKTESKPYLIKKNDH